MSEIQKQELTSMNIAEEQLRKLKELFPEAFTEGLSVDWDKFRLTLGQSIDVGKERYGMNWPGKADCFKTIQQPSIATLLPAREESVDFDKSENLFIEGDNLEVLKLLQKSYLGRIKFMYFDPPYNTGKDFIYPDNYAESLDTYLEYTGQVDAEGKKFGTNTDTDGRFHSKWLNMMYPRLFLAKNLMSADGVIFISISDAEVDNLKKMCNEIFGEENFIAQLVWANKEGGGGSDSKYFRIKHEYILCFGKSKESALINGVDISNEDRYSMQDEYFEKRGPYYLQKLNQSSIQYSKSLDYPIISPDGDELLPAQGDKRACWRWGREKVDWGLSSGFIEFKKDRDGIWQVYSKQYLYVDNEDNPIERKNRPLGIIEEYSSTQGSKQIEQLIGPKVFSYPKPVDLISYLISLIPFSDNDYVLDIFSGSGTTAHSVLESNLADKINRRFICVQLPEQVDEKSEAFKVGFKTISEISRSRIKKAAELVNVELENEKLKSSSQLNFADSISNLILDFGFKVFKLSKSNFKIWDNTLEKEPEVIQAKLFEHIQHISPEAEQEAILYELLLKSGFELTTPIEKLTLAGLTVFSIAEGQLLICLEKELTHDCIKAIAEMQPTRVICLDEGFKGENADALKTNAAQIMKSKGVVNFRTV